MTRESTLTATIDRIERSSRVLTLRSAGNTESVVVQVRPGAALSDTADAALAGLQSVVASLLNVARQDVDSSERRIARRVLAGLRASRRGVPNQKYQEWMESVQPPAPPPTR